MSDTDPLPKFKTPPLVETATSVQFKELTSLTSSLLGVFWRDRLRKTYREITDAEPLDPQFERFSDRPAERPRLPAVRFGPFPGVRLQAASEDSHSMVQIQNDRLVYNWRRFGTGVYPHWETTLPSFLAVADDLKSFLAAESLGDFEPNQWEVVYVNQLVRGKDWDSPADWPALVPGILGERIGVRELDTESVFAGIRLQIQPKRGRLYVELRHGLEGSGDDATDVLSLQLLARGPIDDGVPGLAEGLSLGRSLIVKTFADVTGKQAHERWGRYE